MVGPQLDGLDEIADTREDTVVEPAVGELIVRDLDPFVGSPR
jgi:hypothetical protein